MQHLRRFSRISLSIAALTLFFSCSIRREPELIRSTAIPDGYTAYSAGTWRNTDGTDHTVLLLKSIKENQYILYYEGTELASFKLDSINEAYFGNKENEFLLTGRDEDNNLIIAGVEGVLQSLEDSHFIPTVTICSNGIDYAYTNGTGLYHNNRLVSRGRYFYNIQFSPRGRLVYGVTDTDRFLTLRNEQSIIVPPGAYYSSSDLNMWFDTRGRLMIMQDYSKEEDGRATVRREGMFSKEEQVLRKDKEAYREYLIDHILFYLEHEDLPYAKRMQLDYDWETRSVLYRMGEKYQIRDFITSFSVNRNGDTPYTVSYTAEKLKDGVFNQTTYRSNGLESLPIEVELKICQGTKVLFREDLMKLVPWNKLLNRDIWTINDPLISLSYLQHSAVTTELQMAGVSTPLLQLTLPITESDISSKTSMKRISYKTFLFTTKTDINTDVANQEYQTLLQIGKNPQEGIEKFRLYPNQSALPVDSCIAIDHEGKEHLVLDGRILEDSYTQIITAQGLPGNSMDILVQQDNTVLTLHLEGKESMVKISPDEAAASLPDIKDLKVYTCIEDDDGIYAATNNGLFFSFKNKRVADKNWKNYSGSGVAQNIDPEKVDTIQIDGERGVLLSNGQIWLSRNGGSIWTPAEGGISASQIHLWGESFLSAAPQANLVQASVENPDQLKELPVSGRWFRLREFDTSLYFISIDLDLLEITADGNPEKFIWHPGGDPRRENITDIYTDDNLMILGTLDGLFISRDSGSHWDRKTVKDGLGGNMIRQVEKQGNTLIVSTGTTIVEQNPRGAVRFEFIGYPQGRFSWSNDQLRYQYFFNRSSRHNEPLLEYSIGERLDDEWIWDTEDRNVAYREADCYDGISISRDGGKTWKAIRLDSISAQEKEIYYTLSLVVAGSDLYLTNGTEILSSDDLGENWKSMPLPENQYIYKLEFHNNTLYAYIHESIKNGTENLHRLYRQENGDWKRVIPQTGEAYRGDLCKKLESDAGHVYAYPKGSPAMVYTKATRTWAFLEE